MRVRATIVIDLELSDQEAHEKFGAFDPMTAARSIRAAAEKGLTEHFRDEPHVANVSCTVHPLYG